MAQVGHSTVNCSSGNGLLGGEAVTGAPNRACARPEQLPDLKTGPKYEALTTYLKDAKQLKQLMQSPISTNPEASARTHFIANGFLDALSR